MKAFIKKIFPVTFWQKIQRMRALIDFSLAKVSVKSRLLSSLFYTFISSQFHREHQSVLAGRIAYSDALHNIKESNPLLRRNIHRLEKGLIMVPRKSTFAEAYILETVQIFEKCFNKDGFCNLEAKWALDVLSSYFSVVSDTVIIANARLLFNKCISAQQLEEHNDIAIADKEQSASPYSSDARLKANINDVELFTLFKQRRSVRWFDDKPVALATIERALDMALQAPSACNRQPFEFYTCIDPKVAAEIASIPTGTKGFSGNIQALIVIVGDLSAYPYERDRHVIYIDSGLVAMQLMLAFETLGLSTCPINWPDIESYEIKLSNRLQLPLFKRPIMMMAVGYAKSTGGIPYSQKKKATQLIRVID